MWGEIMPRKKATEEKVEDIKDVEIIEPEKAELLEGTARTNIKYDGEFYVSGSVVRFKKEDLNLLLPYVEM